MLKSVPKFNIQDAEKIAYEVFGLETSAVLLHGERDQNFLLTGKDENLFILKVANTEEDYKLLEAQNLAMKHVADQESLCPKPIPSREGRDISEVESGDGTEYYIRLLSFLKDIPLGNLNKHPDSLMVDLGRRIASLRAMLHNFENKAFHREFDWDLATCLQIIEEHLPLVKDRDLVSFIGKSVSEYEEIVIPSLKKLEKSIIHNDANDYNVIIDYKKVHSIQVPFVSGFIDFGDMIYSLSIGDLAVSIAYAILDKNDPLEAASLIVKGYNEVSILSDEEISVLFPLVCIRLCISICIAAYHQKQRPDNEYLFISQEPIRKITPILMEISPRFAEAKFRLECERDPLPSNTILLGWIKSSKFDFASVLRLDPAKSSVLVFDLGISSPLINGDETKNSEPDLSKRLMEELSLYNAEMGIGKYNEARLLYNSPIFSSSKQVVPQQRTVHLGIDLFAEAGSSVFAPLDAIIYSFTSAPEPLDYGHVIVLKHNPEDGLVFYTLYGHLSKLSLEGIHIGKKLNKGDEFAFLGNPMENGGWTPHLHFQVITDLLDLDCNFPGVCNPEEREIWTAFSPDPNNILGIPESNFPDNEPCKEETLINRNKFLGKNLSLVYDDPVKIVRGWMQYLYDETGKKYLDAYNNVPHVGHCHPDIIKAGQDQMAVLNTNTRYLHDFITRYAESLSSTMPDPLNICYFVNSASEANELALRLAFAHTGQKDIIVLERAYHGNTNILIDISPYKHDGPGGKGAPSWVHTAPVPDVYRGPFKATEGDAGEKYAGKVKEIIDGIDGLAGFISETCPSAGGQIIFPDGYLDKVYDYIRKAGGLCIADEVQTGFGRTGTHFYAFEALDVIPDIVVLGKPIGNGHPIAAVVTTAEIAASFDTGMEYFSTFGGNTVSCAVGLAVLEEIKKGKMQKSALEVGDYLLKRIDSLREDYPIIGDVRGSGLFIGVELVRDQNTLEPATEEASFICNRLREENILIGTDGPYHNVLKIRPPMPFNLDDAKILVTVLENILDTYFRIS